MNNIDLLVLNGSPGSGKSTLADAISDELREANIAHVVIDVDELARIFPEADDALKWKNLQAIWSNYATFPDLKIILPVLIDDKNNLDALRHAAPARSFTICELIAPAETLLRRVTEREPNEYWQQKLRGLVQRYAQRSESQKFGDFQVNTATESITQTARKIVQQLGWSGETRTSGLEGPCPAV